MVDDDESVRRSLLRLLRSVGLEAMAFPSASQDGPGWAEYPFVARLTSVQAGTGAQAGVWLYGFVEQAIDPTTGLPSDLAFGRASDLSGAARILMMGAHVLRAGVNRQIIDLMFEGQRERGANYVEGGVWKPFAVRDGRLITGQQQYSGTKVAELVIHALGR